MGGGGGARPGLSFRGLLVTRGAADGSQVCAAQSVPGLLRLRAAKLAHFGFWPKADANSQNESDQGPFHIAALTRYDVLLILGARNETA